MDRQVIPTFHFLPLLSVCSETFESLVFGYTLFSLTCSILPDVSSKSRQLPVFADLHFISQLAVPDKFAFISVNILIR